jgi:uncharacterized protein YndB with AHSA1/START domain
MKNAGTLNFTTPSDREFVMTRVFDAPRRHVWEAWTNPRHLPHWMLGPEGWTMPVCEIDLRPGGTWHFVWERSDGTGMGMRGVYKEIEPPERLVSTESWGGDWPETLNTLILSGENGKTTITSRIRYPSKEARDAALETGMKEGVSQSFVRLAEYLRTMTQGEKTMKYICLGYFDEKKWEAMSESEQTAVLDECFAYDDVLRKNGHFVGGEALQSARNAATLRLKNGKVSITDGPFAETKEQLGGILILEATDLNHAIRLLSKHPGLKVGPFEIRPVDDMSAVVAESERRRSRAVGE